MGRCQLGRARADRPSPRPVLCPQWLRRCLAGSSLPGTGSPENAHRCRAYGGPSDEVVDPNPKTVSFMGPVSRTRVSSLIQGASRLAPVASASAAASDSLPLWLKPPSTTRQPFGVVRTSKSSPSGVRVDHRLLDPFIAVSAPARFAPHVAPRRIRGWHRAARRRIVSSPSRPSRRGAVCGSRRGSWRSPSLCRCMG